ncbi:MAG TPA: isoaspartyl peptidase/L-asparaginase, partial [Acidobacteriota bacterium]|nr:isoaspartyl peptidase/L-asparaginase [Acidobacteriota bacterium]
DEFGNAGSVSFLQDIMHPISVARMVMEKTPHVMLSGKGAQMFAVDNGFPLQNLLTEKARKAWEDWKVKSEYKPVINIERHDTIGIVAMDAAKRISGACTTSGLAFKMHGRVGDSPVIGAGMFSDWPVVGAVAASGAAPIFFSPVLGNLVDGGVGVHGNPCLAATAEAMEYIGAAEGWYSGHFAGR